MILTTEERNARIIAAQRASRPDITNFSHDIGLPTKAVGYASGLGTATFITTQYRKSHRPMSLNVTCEEVVQVIVGAGVEQWVLMGLYGYVGYLANPRATQDVDVLVAEAELEALLRALSARWPTLVLDRQQVVVRFRDPGEIAIDGEMKQVIDVMRPSDDCYAAVLAEFFRIDPITGHRIPQLEAAIASKYAALVSPNRDWSKKAYDAADLRSMMLVNFGVVNRQRLRQLGELVFPGGGAELLEFLELAHDQKPFPV